MLPQSENSFGLVRLGCALAVIASHAMVLATGERTADPFLGATGFKIGDHAVNIFFVLSGIVTAASLDRSQSLTSFMWGRALRIVPAVFAFALVFGFLIAPFLAALPAGRFITERETWSFILRTITFAPGNTSLPGVFLANPLPIITNESLWTVKYEILCYVALALGAAVLARFGRNALIGGVAAVLLGYVATVFYKLPEGTLSHLRHFSFCYALGLAAYLFADRLPISITGVLAALTALIWSIGSPLQPMATIVFTGYTALWVSSYAFGGWRQWTNRTDLSYGLYVWGWPVGQILLDGVPGLSWPVLAAFNVLFAAAFATLSWMLVEKPALLLKPGKRSTAAPSVVHRDVPENVTPAADQASADEWRGALSSPRTFSRPLGSGW